MDSEGNFKPVQPAKQAGEDGMQKLKKFGKGATGVSRERLSSHWP